ncbi:hypothetical protein R3P38DRAFT_881465 [Favolaschia claudopus]|uniref:Uncharacterized protein n=1 Tax=Favolaschia claudopus TaxID=2862362 RepID=A0AAW0BSM6_9AGAR
MFHKPTLILKSTYAAITLSRVTIAFFLFSLIHCFAQGIIQALLYSVDSEFEGVVTQIVQAAKIPLQNLTLLQGSPNHWTLSMCDDIPHGQPRYPCSVIFQSGVGVGKTPGAVEAGIRDSVSILQDYNAGFTVAPSFDSNNSLAGVTVESSAAPPVFLSRQCARILVYPQQVLQNSVREDITFIFFQFWLMGVSLFGVSRGSIPHMLTALGSRFLITAWSSYILIYRTNSQKGIFQEIVSTPGTECGVELFPTYFGTRYAFNVADAVLNFSALFVSGLLSWNLLKVYKAQSVKRVGAPENVMRIYKFFMAVQAVLQLEVFVLIVATSLWVDLLTKTAISVLSTHTTLYNALILATTILVIPWIALGWYGVRLERKSFIISFLGVGFFFIAGWSIMFYSIVYRWSFVQWPYLACFGVASFILIIASMVLATICWRNFDQGLAEYLHAEAALADFTPEVFQHSDIEKSGEKNGDFYTYDEPDFPLPTFHAKAHSRSGSDSSFPAPIRGPPPSYDKPYSSKPMPF